MFMKKLLLTLFLIIIPTFIYADIAGPVLTKDQACTEKDGASRNRLQIFLN